MMLRLLFIVLFASSVVHADSPAAPLPDLQASKAAVNGLTKYLTAADATEIAKQPFANVALSSVDAIVAEQKLWEDHVQTIRSERAKEMEARELTLGELRMPFFYKVFGEKPASGRSLYISMHGGGGTAKRVNDSQWQNQKRLYQLEEGVYLAPRAPTDKWNLWHQKHIDVLFDRLIENMIVFEDVDPNQVYIMGYSAGGDGVYQLAPRMADRWAAAAMMAGHPNNASPLSMRNIGFTLHMGGRDAAYKRNKIAAQWKERLARLAQEDPGGYPHLVTIHEGLGHWMNRKDAVALPWMAKFTRDPFPRKIVWHKRDDMHSRFYWLSVDAKSKCTLTATQTKQSFAITADGVDTVTLRLNPQNVELDSPITVTMNGKQVFTGRANRTIGTIAKSIAERGDRKSIAHSEVTVSEQKQ